MDWKIQFDRELEMAADARRRGNEGQARVCARRAAGAVAREYFAMRGLPVRSASAYDLINDLLVVPGLPPEAIPALEYLAMRVTEKFELPVNVDLVRQAVILSECLLGPAE
jgi:hypothetical protein